MMGPGRQSLVLAGNSYNALAGNRGLLYFDETNKWMHEVLIPTADQSHLHLCMVGVALRHLELASSIYTI